MPLLNVVTPKWASPVVKSGQPKSELRLEVGVIHGASGSAFLDTGRVSVLCSVFGPATAHRSVVEGMGILECSVNYPSFTSSPNTPDALSQSDSLTGSGCNQMNTFEKYLSQMAKDALENSVRLDLYPKMVISITMVLLKSSGNTGTDLAALITCGSLALIDASVETIDLVTASSVAVSENSQEFIVEPTIFNPVRGTMTVATLASLKEISQLYSEGRIDTDVMPSLISTACRAAEEMRSGISEFCKTSS